MQVWLRVSLAGSATLFVGMGLGRFSYTPLIPALIDGGALSAAEAGYVAAFNLAGYLAGALAAPRFRARWGETPTLRAALVVSLASLAASVAPWGFGWLAFWRFLIGGAVAVMMIYGIAIVTRSAKTGQLGAATGIVFTGVGIGILLSGTLVPLLLGLGMEAAWGGLAVIGAAGVGIALWGWRAAASESHRPPAMPSPSRIRWPAPPILRLICAQSLFSIGLIPHTIYWVDYLVRGLGKDIATGGMHWVLFGAGAVSGTYVWGRVADRIGFRAALVAVLAVLAAGVAAPVLDTSDGVLVLSSLIVGAQPGFSAILSGRTHQVAGGARMAEIWRSMALVSGVTQAVGGYAYVSLFAFAESYTPVFLAGGAAMALGALVSLQIKSPASEPR